MKCWNCRSTSDPIVSGATQNRYCGNCGAKLIVEQEDEGYREYLRTLTNEQLLEVIDMLMKDAERLRTSIDNLEGVIR